MRKTNDGRLIYSPSDLTRFLESPYSTWMDRYNLEHPGGLTPDEKDLQLELVAAEGDKHEAAYLAKMRLEHGAIVEIQTQFGFKRAAAQTREAIENRAPIIVQASLHSGEFAGYADFLKLGVSGEYEVWDTKLGRSPKPYYMVQLCCYADLLSGIVGKVPSTIGVVMVSSVARLHSTGEALDARSFRTQDYWYYYLNLKESFLRAMADFKPDLSLRPEPDARADHGCWQSYVDAWITETDHLSQVADIRKSQIKKLEEAGVCTVAAIARLAPQKVPRLAPEMLGKLINQARVQVATRILREQNPNATPVFEILPHSPDSARGLAALPPANAEDIYFDMEGYPMIVGGLEYLFGACYREYDKLRFRDWWAHDRGSEKKAFEGFVDWAHARWLAAPSLHIYHYAAYEVSALRRLSTFHATRVDMVDDLLRAKAFIDLYKVVREGILLGEDSYSIKKVENLYGVTRTGVVGTAGDSMVEYAKWIASGESPVPAESPILTHIRKYNEDDCRSTAELVAWLRNLQVCHNIGYAMDVSPAKAVRSENAVAKAAAQADADALRDALLTAAYDGSGALVRSDWETLGYLLDFHSREAKPIWWRKFDRVDASLENLADDIACLSCVEISGSPRDEKRSLVQAFTFSPGEDTKLRVGDKVMFTHEADPKFEIVAFDGKAGRLELKVGQKALEKYFNGQFPSAGSLIPDEFVSSDSIVAGIRRAAKLYRDGRHPLLHSVLTRQPPIPNAGGLVLDGESTMEAAIRVATLMQNSILCIQGPPGTGKTYIGSHVIASLLHAGRRVGIMANSHKAIVNLLYAVGEAVGSSTPFVGVKVGGEEDEPGMAKFPGIHWVKSGGDALDAYQKVGGIIAATAWPFSLAEWDGVLDYLFVEEAGQVSLANLAGVSLAAKNVILLGDQMQLEQPIQGSHPAGTGTSALQYYLQDHATIPPELGIFLNRSFRMHPDVCEFISETVYEGRLKSDQSTSRQRVTLNRTDGLITKGTGIQFVAVEHEGNVQASDEEVERVVAIYQELLGAIFTDSEGKTRPLALNDFLFISPYNLQVSRLRARLGGGAQIGSVDKFQGQEAPVTILSMGASFGEYGSRGLSFLLDKNRINVAISRAKCLAIIVGDPRIVQTRAASIREIELINVFAGLLANK